MDNTLRQRYKWFKTATNSIYHSVAIGVSAETAASRLDIDTDLPIVGVRLGLPFAVSVLSVYLPNGKLPDLQNRLQDVLQQVPEPVIIVGDVNGHHRAWGGSKNNIRGNCVMEFACANDLVILNDGSPTFQRGTTETVIDIALASSSISARLLWHAVEDPHGSDHSPIIITLNNSSPPETTRRPRWLYEKADWAAFQAAVEEEIGTGTHTSMEEITSAIILAAGQTIPKTSPKPGKRALHWWDETTKAAVKFRRKTLRAFKRAKDRLPPDHPDIALANENYKNARNACRQEIREAKEKSWKEFLDSINDQQSSAELWQKINGLQGKRRVKGMCLTVNGQPTRDPQIIAETLAGYFYGLSSIENYPIPFLKAHPSPRTAVARFAVPPDRGQNFNLPFRLPELEFALSKAKGKSSGPDELGYPMLRNLPPSCKRSLLQAVNDIWASGALPAEWKHSLVVPIPKGTGPANKASSYRPIALTSCASKIMEKMVNRRLVEHLETNGHLDHRQHAFRAGRGTGTFLAELGQTLDDALDSNQHIELISLDLAKAYNRAWTPDVLERLARWGITGNLLQFLKDFLVGRTFQVIVGNNRSSPHDEETGVPQGSVIAVTIFLVAMSGIYQTIPRGVFLKVYADDITLIVVGMHPKAIRRKAQAATTAVGKWAAKAGFDISAAKSGRLHICAENHQPPRKPITLNQETIPTKKTLKTLGVTLDRHLTLQAHFDQVKKSCKSRLNLLRSISGKRTRSDRATHLRVADAIIGSRITYGIELTCRAQDRLIRTLAPIHNRAIRTISGLLPSTPADAACAEAGVLPFRHKVALTTCDRAIGFLEKTRENGQGCFLAEQANLALQTAANATLPPVAGLHRLGPRSWSARAPEVDNTIKKRFRRQAQPQQVQAHFHERIRKRYHNWAIRYSDGSKVGERVGVGVHGTEPEQHHRLPAECSVFSAEAAGIFQAITAPRDRPVLVVTDSQSAISAIESPKAKHPFIQGVQAELDSAEHLTALMWIPGHCGIRGNERADELAGIGRNSPLLTPKTPADDVKKWVRDTIWRSWSDEWRRDRILFLRKSKPSTGPGEDLPNRREQTVLSRLRTGHTRVSHSMTTNSSGFHRQCEICVTPNTVEHFLCTCPVYEALRQTHQVTDVPRSLANDKVNERQVINYLKEAGLFDNI